MKSMIQEGIELIKLWREDTESEEQMIWLFMFDNYLALQDGKLEQFKIDKLNVINPEWVEHVENEIIKVYQDAIGA